MKHNILTTYFEERSDKMLGKNVTYKIDQEGLVKTEVDELVGRLRRATSKLLAEGLFEVKYSI